MGMRIDYAAGWDSDERTVTIRKCKKPMMILTAGSENGWIVGRYRYKPVQALTQRLEQLEAIHGEHIAVEDQQIELR